MKPICQDVQGCRIPVGARHLKTCPRYGALSGPSGKGLQPRSNVDTTKIDRLRELLGVGKETAPNEVLDGAIDELDEKENNANKYSLDAWPRKEETE